MRNRSFRAASLAVIVAACAMMPAASAEERILDEGRWYPSLESGLNFSQSAYSDNWAGGDRGSIVWTFITNGTLENQLSHKMNWNSTLKLAYGQTHQQRSVGAQRKWESPKKSTDLVDLESTLRFTLDRWVDPFLTFRFETQFQDGSDNSGRSLAFNPLTFKETGGVARKFIEEEERSLLGRLGFSLRHNRRRLFLSSDPNDDATQVATELDGGAQWITDYKAKIFDDRVAWTSRLDLYKPFFYSGKEAFDSVSKEEYEAAGIGVDVANYTLGGEVTWENIFSAQLTKILSVNLYTLWVYDKYDNSVAADVDGDGKLLNAADVIAAIRKAGQFKQTLAVGIIYRFL